MANTLPNVPPNAPAEVQNSVLNQVIDYINQQQRTQIINDGQTNRFLFGYQSGGWPGGDFGMKISKAGVDVTTASDADLIYKWDFATGNIWYNGGTSYWYDSTFTHNFLQVGLLPDGSDGWSAAAPNKNVADGYS